MNVYFFLQISLFFSLDLSPDSPISFSFDLLPIKKEGIEGEKEEEKSESTISVIFLIYIDIIEI